MQTLTLPIGQIRLNDDNPRLIRGAKDGGLFGSNKKGWTRLLFCLFWCIFGIALNAVSMPYTCKSCAADFIPKRASARNPKYCSLACAGVGARGRVASEETRQKLSKALLGRTCPATTGDKHPMWKGGITAKHIAVRASAPVKQWRLAVLKRHGYTCQHCGIKDRYLHAHHIKPFAQFPELRAELSNGIALCPDCHGKVHGLIFTIKPLNSCPDCNKRIKVGAKRCLICSMAHTAANGPKCLNCGVRVKVRNTRCRSCAAVIRIAKTGHVDFWIKKNA